MRIILLFLILLSYQGLAQVSISGRVLSDATEAPLQGASVYINNSTLGAVTDADGSFRIGPVRPGNFELVVSFVSYETILHPIAVADKDLRFEFRMTAGAKAMRGIYIMSEAKRKTMLWLFRTQFLGMGYRADRCEILNEDDIGFSEGENEGQVIAFSDTPIIVINRILGYKVSFTLEDFIYDKRNNMSRFIGYARYEELEGETKKWERNRRDAYQGSTMHFFRSMFEGKAAANDFFIYTLQPGKNVSLRSASPSPEGMFLLKDVGGTPFALDWKGTISVIYRKDPPGKGYLETKVGYMNNPAKGVESQLEMLKGPAYLAPNGMLRDPLSVRFSGYWAHEKLADMLPVDYYPSN